MSLRLCWSCDDMLLWTLFDFFFASFILEKKPATNNNKTPKMNRFQLIILHYLPGNLYCGTCAHINKRIYDFIQHKESKTRRTETHTEKSSALNNSLVVMLHAAMFILITACNMSSVLNNEIESQSYLFTSISFVLPVCRNVLDSRIFSLVVTLKVYKHFMNVWYESSCNR